MPTIKETIIEIREFQHEMEKDANSCEFKQELFKFTSVMYFDYLAHAALDSAKTSLNIPTASAYQKKYYALCTDDMFSNYIRFNNIGQLTSIWNAYEKYLRAKYSTVVGGKKFQIAETFSALLAALEIVRADVTSEFDVMRNTRNSLHDGGVCDSNFKSFTGTLRGKTYTFNPGQPVVPLRTMDVVQTMWSHYRIIENSKGFLQG